MPSAFRTTRCETAGRSATDSIDEPRALVGGSATVLLEIGNELVRVLSVSTSDKEHRFESDASLRHVAERRLDPGGLDERLQKQDFSVRTRVHPDEHIVVGHGRSL